MKELAATEKNQLNEMHLDPWKNNREQRTGQYWANVKVNRGSQRLRINDDYSVYLLDLFSV